MSYHATPRLSRRALRGLGLGLSIDDLTNDASQAYQTGSQVYSTVAPIVNGTPTQTPVSPGASTLPPGTIVARPPAPPSGTVPGAPAKPIVAPPTGKSAVPVVKGPAPAAPTGQNVFDHWGLVAVGGAAAVVILVLALK